MDPLSSRNAPYLPPQCIVLQLDTGDSVFLRLLYSDAENFQFVSSRYRVSKPMLKLQPGMHLAVDCSSRYMAIGCSEGVFAIYALRSRSELKDLSLKTPGEALKYISSETQIYFHGTILKMEFLHPAIDDESHVILLLLIVVRGKTRMLVYEWQTGQDLKQIRAHSVKGHELKPPHQMPLLLIPLRIRSKFILVCEDSMAVCAGILERTPEITVLSDRRDEPTAFHHGSGNPLWVSWTRPTRNKSHLETRDDIFLAREDGLVKFLEIDSKESPVVKSDMNIGFFEANCGTAFASLDFMAKDPEPKSADVLVIGGDSCSGGTYLVREIPELALNGLQFTLNITES
jgi:hypothetical protein